VTCDIIYRTRGSAGLGVANVERGAEGPHDLFPSNGKAFDGSFTKTPRVEVVVILYSILAMLEPQSVGYDE